ncbi:hypothetical protein RclHR1_00920017 [Rhizophagus clarus]|uniref:Uncharacterized protein n=1 Tax=Rhizophagus clarus TaxID=94130 RepID=A0A2Z6SQ46_9GLOM|nr:hypothetical protein RclHR1_00920017 [Rhizophagus clarus]
MTESDKLLTPEYLDWHAKLSGLPSVLTDKIQPCFSASGQASDFKPITFKVKPDSELIIKSVLEHFPYLKFRNSFRGIDNYNFTSSQPWSSPCPICNGKHGNYGLHGSWYCENGNQFPYDPELAKLYSQDKLEYCLTCNTSKVQGAQHQLHNTSWYKDVKKLEDIVDRNQKKRTLCQLNGIYLLEVCASSDADEIVKFRSLWWEKGIFHPKAKWEEEKLPYTLVKSVSLEEYELHADKFNVHGCWDWKENKVIVYEWPSKPHETFIGEITVEIINHFNAVCGAPAHISSMGAELNEPWPNVVIEVAYSESQTDVLSKVQDFWLKNNSRVHDVIVVKIDYIALGKTPTRMQFEFGTHDQAGNPLNILPGTCVININLDCFYHNIFPRISIPRNQVPDPIQLDFLLLRNYFLRAFEKR